MTPAAIRIAIAEACGWRWLATVHPHEIAHQEGGMVRAFFPPHISPDGWSPADGTERVCGEEWVARRTMPIPNYLNDLNAMHEAEKVLTKEQEYKYVELLVGLVWDEPWGFTDAAKAIHATAAQRAEAFLRAIGKWKDK